MAELERFRIEMPKSGLSVLERNIDVNNARSIGYHVSSDGMPTFTIDTNGLPDIEIAGNIKFRFTPETVQQAATVLRNEFIENMDSRKALVASIESVLQEESGEYLLHDLSEKIANRIIGLEDD